MDRPPLPNRGGRYSVSQSRKIVESLVETVSDEMGFRDMYEFALGWSDGW